MISMLSATQIPDEVWRVAMVTYHREFRRNPERAWQLAIAAALTTWPHVALSTHVEEGRRIILPLQETKP
jgi:hypothetical protein